MCPPPSEAVLGLPCELLIQRRFLMVLCPHCVCPCDEFVVPVLEFLPTLSRELSLSEPLSRDDSMALGKDGESLEKMPLARRICWLQWMGTSTGEQGANF